MSGTWGNKLKLSIFGESHGGGIGIVISDLPPGIELDMDFINKQMARRAPGRSNLATARVEKDYVQILSGFFEGKTTGAPLCGVIYNDDTRSKDYSELKELMRPGHSDYPAYVKYLGFNDYRGGGHFSGRITAPLLFAGAIATQILQKYKGIVIGSRIKSIGSIEDEIPGNTALDDRLLLSLKDMDFPVLSEERAAQMKEAILAAKADNDSVGGVVEVFINNVPAGYGNPFFDSVESRLSHMLFSVPAIKGLEFGAGFGITKLRGSKANDCYYLSEGKICAKSNNNGGIIGGITDGMPIVFRAAVKPTASISLPQKTVNVCSMKESELEIVGRHDPCIVSRIFPVIEGTAAITLLDLIMERDGEIWTAR